MYLRIQRGRIALHKKRTGSVRSDPVLSGGSGAGGEFAGQGSVTVLRGQMRRGGAAVRQNSRLPLATAEWSGKTRIALREGRSTPAPASASMRAVSAWRKKMASPSPVKPSLE